MTATMAVVVAVVTTTIPIPKLEKSGRNFPCQQPKPSKRKKWKLLYNSINNIKKKLKDIFVNLQNNKMSINKTGYLITVGEPDNNTDGIFADEFEETLIYVGRLIERLHKDENFEGKYIYVVEHELLDNGTFVRQNYLFSNRYLIEK